MCGVFERMGIVYIHYDINCFGRVQHSDMDLPCEPFYSYREVVYGPSEVSLFTGSVRMSIPVVMNGQVG